VPSVSYDLTSTSARISIAAQWLHPWYDWRRRRSEIPVRRLVKQSQQLVDRSDALMRETEAALFASQKALRAAMARKL